MFVSRSIGLCILLNFNVLCQERRLSQKFAYPEDEEEKRNAQRKTPVYLADFCKSGELFYPGDQGDDWLCDCKPAYLYHPATDQCYPAYKQGPCKTGECLILPPNSGVPKCRPNPCAKDNFVRFRDDCHELDKPGPCDLPELWNVVGVNETTLNIICTKDYQINLFSRVVDEEATPPPIIPGDQSPIVNGTIYAEKRCFIGGKRWARNQCPEQIEQNEKVQSIFAILSSA